MPSPQKAARDKGVSSPASAAAKGFELSNSTMAKFIGGKRKTWMTANPIPQSSPPANRLQNPGTVPSRPDISTATQGSATPSETPATTVLVPDIIPLPSWSQKVITTDAQVFEFNRSQLSTVLPSPAPSDEPRQESTWIVDLEEKEEQPIISEPQPQGEQLSAVEQHVPQNRLPNRTSTTQLEQTTERRVGAEQRESSGYISGNRADLASQPRLESDPGTVPESPAATASNRMPSDDLPSKKRLTSSLRFSPIPSNQPPSLSSSVIDGNSLPQPFTIVFAPTFAEMRNFSERINSRIQHLRAHIQSVRGSGSQRDNFEEGRLALLRDACDVYDHDFLLLHQIHCMATKAPESVLSPSGLALQPVHLEGFLVLSQLIKSNVELPIDAIVWFSDFPLPNMLRRFQAYQLAYRRICQCLVKLGQYWEHLRNKCHLRHYPPLVDEMNALDITSTVLQGVLFRAILRALWVGVHDDCYHKSEQLFVANRQHVQQMYSKIAGPPHNNEANKQVYNQNLGMKYSSLWDTHQEHILYDYQQSMQNTPQPRRLGMAPPQHRQGSSVPAKVDSTIQNRNQARRQSHSVLIPPSMRPTPPIAQSYTPTVPSSSILESQPSPISWVNAPLPQTTQSPLATNNIHIPSIPTTIHTDLQSYHQHRNPSIGDTDKNSPPIQPYQSPLIIHQSRSLDSTQAPALRVIAQAPSRLPAVVPSGINSQSGSAHLHHDTGFQRGRGQSNLFYPTPVTSVGQISPSTANPQLQAQTVAEMLPAPLHPQFLPPSHYIRQTTAQPNPVESALHQAHVRSPIMTVVNPAGEPDNISKPFAFIWGIAVMPNRLEKHKGHFRWTFAVDKENFELLAKNVEGFQGSPFQRSISINSRLCRIRCVKVPVPGEEFGESDWAVADNTWPNGIAVLLNGTALEIRKKLHHGKDLPVDVTSYIQEGQNTLTVATIWHPEDSATVYAVGLETLQITTAEKIKDEIPTLEWSQARKRIVGHLSNFDPDIQVISPSITLDLTDPYTSSMVMTPVRGKTCRHNQCFDLDIFLRTRARKTSTEPCAPDQFKCPICDGDARPQSLVIDGFFQEIRDELSRTKRLDTRAIVLHENGSWEIKEDELTGESGDGSGSAPSHGKELVAALARDAPIRGNGEVIEIDDD